VSFKSVRMAYPYFVSEASVIENIKRMYLVTICGMSYSIVFSTLSDTQHAFQKRFIEYKI